MSPAPPPAPPKLDRPPHSPKRERKHAEWSHTPHPSAGLRCHVIVDRELTGTRTRLTSARALARCHGHCDATSARALARRHGHLERGAPSGAHDGAHSLAAASLFVAALAAAAATALAAAAATALAMASADKRPPPPPPPPRLNPRSSRPTETQSQIEIEIEIETQSQILPSHGGHSAMRARNQPHCWHALLIRPRPIGCPWWACKSVHA